MNMASSSPRRLALIAGPTASGKSALALRLAEAAGGTIVNADSAQVYSDLRIISARPSPEEEARAPHRLYGYRDGAEACSAAGWAADAKRAISEAHETGRLPILVGGTGLYIRTLLDGIAPVPEIDPAIRAAVRSFDVLHNYEALEREDPAAAARLRPSDSTRVGRALEVVRSTGRPLSEWQKERSGGIAGEVELAPMILMPPRDEVYARCDDRFEKMMLDEGLEEVRLLLERKLNPLLPVMRAIGVREIAAYLRGEKSRDEALEAGRIATRQYAKRQYTWFSRQPPADWPRLADGIAAQGQLP
ncbi:MAG TPA: tRNA (adenosine(37)-N6)-dimethylallyltransferase MiaA [Allosphingosinicella sp.]|jgi:tRNA dimethylallyltransferase